MRLQPTSEDIPQRLPRRVVFLERWHLADTMLRLIAQDGVPPDSKTAVHLTVALSVLADLKTVMAQEGLVPRLARP